MKSAICTLALILAHGAAMTLHAASPAATQKWVADYVSTFIATGGVANSGAKIAQNVSSNGFVTMTGFTSSNDWVTINGEYPDRLALVISNCSATAVAQGFTNDMVFAWDGNHSFYNADRVIVARTNCFYSLGVESKATNGTDRIEGLFDIYPTKVTPSEATRLLAVMRADAACPFSPLDFIFTTAHADTWKGFGEAWYTPIGGYKSSNDNYTWDVTDSSGNQNVIEFTRNGNGFVNNVEEISESIKLSTRALLNNMANLANSIVKNTDHLAKIDEQMETLAGMLDDQFANVWSKIDEIEVKKDDGNGNSEISTYTPTVSESKILLTGTGPIAKPTVDEKSIAYAGEKGGEKLQLKYFGISPDDSIVAKKGGEIWFQYLSLLFDDKSLGLNKSDSQGLDASSWQIYGWKTQGSCQERLTDLIQRPDQSTTHEFLCRVGGANGTLHYLPVGDPLQVGGSFNLGVTGTDASTANVTNNIKFVSSEGNVEVSVDDKGNGKAEIEIKVYYK